MIEKLRSQGNSTIHNSLNIYITKLTKERKSWHNENFKTLKKKLKMPECGKTCSWDQWYKSDHPRKK